MVISPDNREFAVLKRHINDTWNSYWEDVIAKIMLIDIGK